MIDPDRWREIDQLFARVLELPKDERPELLAAASAGDPALRREVELLLAAEEENRGFLEEPAYEAEDEPADGRETGRRLGPYRLLARLQTGGMGEVYRACRDDAGFEREVAVKILRAGLQGTEARARFRAERQILARLEHPGIARLYDGGETEDGRPYLVLELVPGIPVDQYCDRHQLSVRERLALFLRICAAVDHAHRNLLVHRDLKPANVLVTEAGEPKLLDFGIAKQLAPVNGAAGASLTRTGLRVMTPSYARPEQVKGEAITTASDVYSLGVVLYELLTGQSPYRAAGDLLYEVERAICVELPDRPSAAVTRGDPTASPEAIARARKARPRALRRQLLGDLDNVVLMALRKEPARRYGSADQLARDVERYLANLPVVARPDTFLYRSRKFLRRHRAGVAAAGAVALLLLAFVGSLIERGRSLARERDKARLALSFLVDVFKGADPYQNGGEHLEAREILDQGARRVAQLDAEPDVQAAVMDALGQVDLGLGRMKDAAPLLQRSLALRRTALGAGSLAYAESLEHVASLRSLQSNFRGAQALLEQALAVERRALGQGDVRVAKTLNLLGETLRAQGAAGAARRLHQEALAIAREKEGPAGATVAASLIELGELAQVEGDYPRAESLYRQALDLEGRSKGGRDTHFLLDLANFGDVLRNGGKEKEAEALLRSTAKLQGDILGQDHPDCALTLNNLGLLLQLQGKRSEAEALFRRALAILQPQSEESSPTVIAVSHNLALVLGAESKTEEAIRLHEKVLAMRRRLFGERDPQVAQSLLLLAEAYQEVGSYDRAFGLAERALSILRERLGAEHPLVAYPLRRLGYIRMLQGRAREAEPFLRQSLEIRRKTLPADHSELAKAKIGLGICLTYLAEFHEARPLLEEGASTRAAQYGEADEWVRDARIWLAKIDRAERRGRG